VLFRRIALIGASATIIGIPNSILYLRGYGSPALIALEGVLLVLGIVIFILGVTMDTGKLPSYRSSLLILLTVGFALQYSVQIFNSGNPELEILVPVGLFAAAILIFALVLRYGTVLDKRWIKPLSLMIIALIVGAFLYISTLNLPLFNSDEAALNAYAAILSIHGVNPYTTDLAKAFSLFGTPVQYLTPTLSGGFVSSLNYPALSFLLYIPLVVSGVDPYYVLIALYLSPLALLGFVHRRSSPVSMVAATTLVMFNSAYLVQITLGFWDILWVMLTALSLLQMRRPAISGPLYGIALSIKQIPILLLPFLLYHLYRTRGIRTLGIWVFTALTAFLAFNGYFLLKSGGSYIDGVLLPVAGDLFGIGFGISQLSFLGEFSLNADYFVLMMAVTATASFLIYTRVSQRYRVAAMLAAPMLVFFFSYRLITEYLIYWPLIALMILPGGTITDDEGNPTITEPMENEVTRKGLNRKYITMTVAAVIVISVVTVPVFYHPYSMKIDGIAGIPAQASQAGKIGSFTLSVYYSGSTAYSGHIFLRIITGPPLSNENGVIWVSGEVNMPFDGTYLVSFHSTSASYDLPGGSYRGVLYNTTILGSGQFVIPKSA